MTKRIGILALLHESNTFLREPTEQSHFSGNLLATGAAVCDAFRGTPHEVGGFLSAIDASPGFSAVGIFGGACDAIRADFSRLLESAVR
jgi:hypothetical protein